MYTWWATCSIHQANQCARILPEVEGDGHGLYYGNSNKIDDRPIVKEQLKCKKNIVPEQEKFSVFMFLAFVVVRFVMLSLAWLSNKSSEAALPWL